ncbi:AraC family transcriptional regulator [Nocardia puris]|uniref:AraC family transcriptional regulator n=1 Tax=Nocardia puris TaxID=208602 RepID=UPI002E1FDA47
MSFDELRALLAKHVRPDETTAIAGLYIAQVHRSGPPETQMSGTVLAVLAQGAKRLAVGEEVFEYRPGDYLVTSLDLPVTGSFVGASRETPALGLALVLDPVTIADLLLAAGAGELPRRQRRTVPAVAVGKLTAELLDALVRLVRLLDHPGDRAVLAPLVTREILWRLIVGEQGEAVQQLGLAESGLHHIGRAVRWIREHYDEPFRVDDLARLSGMSSSAFYRNFQIVTAQSPLQFQKNIRLQHARLLLASNSRDVTGVAHRVGYDSASQFSREYRRLFGEPPSREAKRAFASSSPDLPA